MATTVVYRADPYATARATERDGDLWLALDELEAATGWEYKPQGLCLGERCVPLPPARAAEFFAPDESFNLTAFARYLGQPVVHDERGEVWVFGEAPEVRRAALQSLEAPDFTLPDLDGTLHSLSDYRGKKVLLLAWASW
jgi:hypothetical protein